jgi:hypothetical protein
MKKLLTPALLLLALALYIKFYEVPQIEIEENKKKLFGSFAASEIQGITVKKTNSSLDFVNPEPKKEVVKDPSEGVEVEDPSLSKQATTPWILKNVPEAILDKAKIEGLATSIANFSSEKTVDQKDLETDLATYGLASPELTISVRVAGKEQVIDFGKKSEFISARYVKVHGRDGLFLVDDSLFDAASVTQSEFRDKTPVTFSDDEVQNISMTSPEGKVVIEPSAEKTFRIVEPIKSLAQNYAVFDVYRNLRNLQADIFIDAPTDLSLYGLDNPQDTIVINRANGPLTVTVGLKNDKEFFQINKKGTVYQAIGHPLSGLSAKTETFREAQQFKFDHFIVTKALVEKNASPYLVLTKDKDQYQVNSEKADAPFVRQYLRDISELRVQSFLPFDDAVLKAKPFVRVVISTDTSQIKKDLVLIIGEKRGDFYPSYVEGINEPFMINQENFQVIVPALEKFKPVVEPTPTNVANP